MDSQGKYQTLTSFHDHMAIGGDGSGKSANKLLGLASQFANCTMMSLDLKPCI